VLTSLTARLSMAEYRGNLFLLLTWFTSQPGHIRKNTRRKYNKSGKLSKSIIIKKRLRQKTTAQRNFNTKA